MLQGITLHGTHDNTSFNTVNFLPGDFKLGLMLLRFRVHFGNTDGDVGIEMGILISGQQQPKLTNNTVFSEVATKTADNFLVHGLCT